jgi:hypothetical protein
MWIVVVVVDEVQDYEIERDGSNVQGWRGARTDQRINFELPSDQGQGRGKGGEADGIVGEKRERLEAKRA